MSLVLCLCSELVIVSGFPLIIMSALAQFAHAQLRGLRGFRH